MAKKANDLTHPQTPIDWPELVNLTGNPIVARQTLEILVKEIDTLTASIDNLIANQQSAQNPILIASVHKLAGAANNCMAHKLKNLLWQIEKYIRDTTEKDADMDWSKVKKLFTKAKQEALKVKKYCAKL